MLLNYYPKGVCTRQFLIDIDEKSDTIKDAKFIGGCSGNLQGISKLIKGMKIDEVIEKLGGTVCRNNTSCPDQIAKALTEYKEKRVD